MKRTIERYTIDSNFMNEERSIYVSLPPGYNELLSYPTLYLQDGVDFLTMGRIVTQANERMGNAELDPFIIVGVNVERKHRTSEYHPRGDRHESYIRFFAEELLPFIESNYPVRKDIDNRVLAGDSLGGTVSLYIALKYRTLFKKILSLSGAFGPETIDDLIDREDLKQVDIYMLIGLDETKVETGRGSFDFLKWNRDLKTLLTEKGTTLHYVEKEGEHTWGFWQKELPDCLSYFFGSSYHL
ncbi:MAG: alpha/beta hydrolase-fold protein [Bacilli bacterium]